MNQWHPVPASLAAALVKRNWTKDNRAPEAVAYLWTWSVMRNGVTVSIRDLGNYAGWSKWKARNMLEMVRRDFNAWENGITKPHQSGQSPDTSRTVAGQLPDTKPQQSQMVAEQNQTVAGQSPDTDRTVAGRSRVIPHTNTKTTTSTKHSSESAPKLKRLWDLIQERRSKYIPGSKPLTLTNQRRRVLKGRLSEHSEQEVLSVVDWWLNATHPRARYLRQEGHGIDTVLRPSNFGQYLDFSREVKIPPKKRKQAPPPKPKELPGLSTYRVEQVDAAKDALADLRETMSPETFKRAVLTYLAQEAK
jgi:hypothetical protein